MTAPTATPPKKRVRRAGRPLRNNRPRRCKFCRSQIVFGIVEEKPGRLRMRADDPKRYAYVRLNARTSPAGDFEYLRGPVAQPVVRELDTLQKLLPTQTHRYRRHRDTVREER